MYVGGIVSCGMFGGNHGEWGLGWGLGWVFVGREVAMMGRWGW